MVGHVFGLDFDGSTGRDIRGLYGAKVRKIVEETSEKLGVLQHLRDAADGVGWLCLWLDCDREGENICFEVIHTALPALRRAAAGQRQVHRAQRRAPPVQLVAAHSFSDGLGLLGGASDRLQRLETLSQRGLR